MLRRLLLQTGRLSMLRRAMADASKSATLVEPTAADDTDEASTSSSPETAAAEAETIRKAVEAQRLASQKRLSEQNKHDVSTQGDGNKTANTVSKPVKDDTDVADYEKEQKQLEERAKQMIAMLRGTSFEEAVQRRVERPPGWQEKLRPVARPRRIVYNEGELENSDLSKPPSRENPHPFDPFKDLPPHRSRTLAPFVNHVPALQKLVEAGVDLFEIDTTTPLAPHLIRLSEKDIEDHFEFLTKDVGMEESALGAYLTRNPFLLIQPIEDLRARVNYLEAKKFTRREIAKVCDEFRYWLNMDVKTVDMRLGWLQRQFRFFGDEVREVIVREPKIVMFGLGPLQRMVVLFNKELEFDPTEIRGVFFNDPRVFLCDPRMVRANYVFLRHGMKLTKEAIVKNPIALRCSLATMRLRHEFLRRRGRARYEGQEEEEVKEKPKEEGSEEKEEDGPVKLRDFLHPNDLHFALKAARTYLAVYNDYLKTR